MISKGSTMTKQLLIYGNVVPLTRRDHGDLSYKSDGKFDFAREVNAAPLLPAEFAAAAAEFPIVFADSAGVPLPLVLLGAGASENLFVDAEGAWSARYQPAFIRRWPFVFSTGADASQYTLCIDDTAPGFNREGRGERLFDADGAPTVYTNQMLGFLREYQVQHELSRRLGEQLKQLDLLHAVEARIQLADLPSRTLTGFQVVNREKLRSLGAETVNELFRSEALELVHLHLFSLRNLDRLREKTMERVVAPGAAA
jgi:hypothetical protein